MTQWPDPNKPGYPVNRDEEGWYLLLLCGEDQPEPARWIPERQQWLLPDVGIYNPENVANEMSYCALCVPYSTAFTAGARAAREQVVNLLKRSDQIREWDLAEEIQSLPLPEPK